MTNHLIFGKDETQRVVGVEPGDSKTCTLFIQDEADTVSRKSVPLTHWLLYTEQHSDIFKRLAGDQPYKWLVEYDEKRKYDEVLKLSRLHRMDLFTMRDPKEAYMVKNGVTMYKGLKVKDVSVLSFDLEHTYGIGDKLNKNGKLLLISNTFRDNKGNLTKRLFSYDEYANEAQMLLDWVDWVSQVDPSVIVGHNLFGHDFKILRHASIKSGVTLRIGRENKELKFDHKKSHFRKDGSQSYEYHNAHAYGREIVDTFFLAIKYDVARNYESYGLKAIIKHEGLEKEGRVHYDASQIIAKHTDPVEWAKIKAYAIDDADDALALYDLMIPSFFYSAQTVPRTLQHIVNSASGGQLNSLMVRAYLQDGHSIAKATQSVDYEGGLSDGYPGVHKNVWKIDIVAMYPSIIRDLKIFNKEKDPQGYFLQIIEHFTNERVTNKRLAKETGDVYYKNLDAVSKVFCNSGYGFLGAGKLNYNSPEHAALITHTGREILRKAVIWATGKQYEIKDSGGVCDSEPAIE